MSIANVIGILFIFVAAAQCEQEKTPPTSEPFLDPHSFHYDRHNKIMRNLYEVESESVDQEPVDTSKNTETCNIKLKKCKDSTKKEVTYEIYYKRLINMIVNKANFLKNSDLLIGSLSIEGTLSEIEHLRDYENGKISIRAIDEILGNVIKTPKTTFHSFAVKHTEALLEYINNNQDLGLYSLGALLFVLLFWRFNKIGVIIFSVAVIVLLSWYNVHQDLIQQEQIKHTTNQMVNMEIPISCQPNKMNWYQLISHSIFGNKDECRKYVEGKMATPEIKVTLVQSLVKMMSEAVFQPIASAGHHCGLFVSNFTSEMSFVEGWLLRIILTIGILLITTLILFFTFFRNLKLFLGPFFSVGLEAHNDVKNTSLSSKVQRVEDLENSPRKKSPARDKKREAIKTNQIIICSDKKMKKISAICAGESESDVSEPAHVKRRILMDEPKSLAKKLIDDSEDLDSDEMMFRINSQLIPRERKTKYLPPTEESEADESDISPPGAYRTLLTKNVKMIAKDTIDGWIKVKQSPRKRDKRPTREKVFDHKGEGDS